VDVAREATRVGLLCRMAAVVAVAVHWKPQLATTAVVCIAYRWGGSNFAIETPGPLLALS
jgi:hypothetical protein